MSVYSISNWNTYPLKDYHEIFHTSNSGTKNDHILLSYSDIIQRHFNGEHQPLSRGHVCTAIWYLSNLIEYTPWIVIPCDHEYFTIANICEAGVDIDILRDFKKGHAVTTQHQVQTMRNISNSHHMNIVVQKGCQPYWTFINESCTE